MEQEAVDLKTRVEVLEEKTQQLADLMAGLANVVQQLMEINNEVLEAAKALRKKKG